MRTKEEIERALQDPGFTPGFRDLPLLLEYAGDPDSSLAVERAMVRLGDSLADKLPEELPLRAFRPICRVLGKLKTSEASFAWLLARLDHGQADVRRAATVSLGKVDAPYRERAEAALLERLAGAERDFEARAIVEALGKIGGSASLPALERWKAERPDDTRVLERARITLERTVNRTERTLDLARALPELEVVYHCRTGLGPILLDELAPLAPTPIDSSRVRIRRAATLAEHFGPRTATRFSFPIAGAGKAPLDRIMAALETPAARAILHEPGKVTRLRFRPKSGKQRELQWSLAAKISETFDWLRNDPKEPDWELSESKDGLELTPRPAVDPRFAYRVADLPAASHPTLAAALARIAEVYPDDVVWDPFAGSALELIEHARLGPAKRRLGTDIDPRAVVAAKENVAAANAPVEIVEMDARAVTSALFGSAPPTLILSNPPFGHRLLSRADVETLLTGMLEKAHGLLAPGGRLVWLSPMPEHTLECARTLGFRAGKLLRVDAGAVLGEVQVLFRR